MELLRDDSRQGLCWFRSFAGSMVLSLVCTTLVSAADDAEEKQRELEEVRARIEALADEVERDTVARGSVLQALRAAERAAGDAARRLRDLEGRLGDGRERLADLDVERQREEDGLVEEREALSAQLRAAYRTGREERVKLLLNQEDPALLGRVMAYYSYFTRARTERIESVLERIERLISIEEEIRVETEYVAGLAAEERVTLDAHEAARSQRQSALAALEREIRSQEGQLRSLRDDEQGLVDLIAHLTSALADIPPESLPAFQDFRGQLEWPVAGTLLADFGQARASGRMRWQGVLIGAAAGTEVRAIAHGRVAYADWLPGLGLLLVLEHGDGYLSLYGHNQSLYKAAGDWVTAGEVIAAVGDSGGQARSGLYYEIRKAQQPLNPQQWARTRLVRP